jgi:hypothetical protein
VTRTISVAPSSVKTHVGHLLTKLGFTDRVHLVVFAYDHGVAKPEIPPARSPVGERTPRPGRAR